MCACVWAGAQASINAAIPPATLTRTHIYSLISVFIFFFLCLISLRGLPHRTHNTNTSTHQHTHTHTSVACRVLIVQATDTIMQIITIILHNHRTIINKIHNNNNRHCHRQIHINSHRHGHSNNHRNHRMHHNTTHTNSSSHRTDHKAMPDQEVSAPITMATKAARPAMPAAGTMWMATIEITSISRSPITAKTKIHRKGKRFSRNLTHLPICISHERTLCVFTLAFDFGLFLILSFRLLDVDP